MAVVVPWAATSPVSAAVSVAAPPRSVDRAGLVRLFARADRVSVAGAFGGARIRTTTRATGEPRQTTRIRVRALRYVARGDCGTAIYDEATMLSYLDVAEAACGADVTPQQLAAGLARLGRSDATWVRIEFVPLLTDGGPHSHVGQVGDLVWLAGNATDWSWIRRRGRITWTVRVSRPGAPQVTARIVLDRRGRVVRETETYRWEQFRSTMRLRVSYGHVPTIALPPASEVVDGNELFRVIPQVGPTARGGAHDRT